MEHLAAGDLAVFHFPAAMSLAAGFLLILFVNLTQISVFKAKHCVSASLELQVLVFPMFCFAQFPLSLGCKSRVLTAVISALLAQ